MDKISLLVLLAVIALGFWKKKNVGLLAMAFAFVLGRFGGIADKTIIAGFSSSTFVSLLGITFWFAVINQTGVVDLLAKKGVAIAGKQQWAIPFLMMFLGFLVSFMGPGAVPACVVCILSIPLAFEMGVSPMLYCLPAFAGLCAGRVSPFTTEGAWLAGEEVAVAQGYTPALTTYVTVSGIVAALACTLVVYIFYKGWKKAPNEYKASELPAFDAKQKYCLISIVVMAVLVVGFSMTTALVCLLLGEILLLLGVGTEKETLRTMPWGTMVLVCGVGLLMTVINALGGIELLSNILSSVMSGRTAAGIMGIVSGMMSWFSSSFGVVWPALIPTVPDLVQTLGSGANGAAIISAIAFGASIAGISPFSSGGSMCISAMSVDSRFDESQTNKCFIQFFAWAVAFLGIAAILCFLGVFDLLAGMML